MHNMIRADLPDVIPIFPLEKAMLLPRSHLPLQIFEPRYVQMVEDVLKTDTRLIGMIQPNIVPGREGTGLQTIGCVGRICQFSEAEDNRYMITLLGVSRFRVVKEIEGFFPYRRCEISWDGFEPDLETEEPDEAFDRVPFLDALMRYFDVRGLSADWDALKNADDELLINLLSMMLDFSAEDKQALLEAPSLRTRRETLVTLIEFALLGGDEGEVMQ